MKRALCIVGGVLSAALVAYITIILCVSMEVARNIMPLSDEE